MEIADVMTFTHHEKLVEKLFAEYQRDPPPGYSAVTLRQVAEADRRAWKMVAEKSAGDLGRDATGCPIVDKLMEEVLVDPAFLTLLLPLPGSKGASSSKGDDEEVQMGAGKRKLLRENQRLKDQLKDAKEQRTDKYPSKNGPATPATKKMPVKMPKELMGLQPMKNKKRLCFGFNLGHCDHTVTNGECEKGLHICMKCWKPGHGAHECKSK